MTAHATIEERQRCVAAGMNDHVAKPIDPAALYDVLRRYCAAAPAAGRVPRRQAPARGRPRGPAARWTASTPRRAFGAWPGNRKLYLRLLRQFAGGPHATPRIGSGRASNAGDRPVAERLAHTVKGTAGNLAAGPVQAAAGALEKAIRDGARSRARGVASSAARRGARSPVGRRFGRWLAERCRRRRRRRPPPHRRWTRPRSRRWSSAGRACSRSATPGPVDDLEREGDVLRALFGGAERFARFAKLVTAYDFDGALEALRRAAGEKGL